MESLEKDRLTALQETLNYKFNDEKLLLEALTHSTFAYEVEKEMLDNQRLEFLGDSVLGLAVAAYLYKTHPDFQEGELTKKKDISGEQKLSGQ